MKNTISASWLWEHINDKNIVIIDCRFDIYNPVYGKRAFQISHLKNAIFFDLDRDLSRAMEIHGGARPLPYLDQLSSIFSKVGINKDTTVIGYDDQIHASARLLWTLKYFGHENCYILDGGFKGWIEQGYPVTTNINSQKIPEEIIPNLNKKMMCEIEYVQQKKDLPDVVLIDSREYERFSGKKEKLYKKAGHIPGAVNFYCNKNFKKGFLREKNDLKKLWSWITSYKEIILYCGSGIGASVNFIALDELGYSPKLYIGGFSDWISYENNSVEQGDGPISKLPKYIKID